MSAVSGVAFTGVSSAQTSLNASINQVEGGDNSDTINATPSDEITVNYTVDGNGNKSIETARLEFEEVNDGSTVTRELPADAVTNREESVAVPDTEGFYAVTLYVEDEDGNSDTDTFNVASGNVTHHDQAGLLIVKTEEPIANIDQPDDGESGSYPTITGTAFDGAGIAAVNLTIQNSSGYYYNHSDGTWESSQTTINVSEAGSVDGNGYYGEQRSWTYDVYDEKDNFTADTYTFTINAQDNDGNVISEPSSEGPPSLGDSKDTGPEQIEYTLSVASPSVDTVEFYDSDAFQSTKTTVNETDQQLPVNVTVSPRGTDTDNVDAAYVESSDLSMDQQELTNRTTSGGDIVFSGVADLGSPTQAEGNVDIEVTVEYTGGETITTTETIELNRAPADLERVSTETEFIGYVHDDADTIEVEIGAVVDADGNLVSADSMDLAIGGQTFEADVSATDGDVEGTIQIDPDQDLSTDNIDSPGEKNIQLKYRGKTITTEATITVVHEAYGLTADQYQPIGTPMQAEEVVLDTEGDRADVLTYDTQSGEWVTPDETSAGSGYMVATPDENGRIGFSFDTGGTGDAQETLQAPADETGWFLVGATANLQSDDPSLEIKEDLKGGDSESVTIDDSSVTVWTASPWIGPESVSRTESWSDTNDFSTTADEFEAYWVEIEAGGELERDFETTGYDPDKREEQLSN